LSNGTPPSTKAKFSLTPNRQNFFNHPGMQLLLYLLINGLAVFTAAYILPGIHVDSFALLNTFLKPILTLLTLPITILTLGLFLLVINVLIVFLADKLVSGLTVENWLSALAFGFLTTLIGSLLSSFHQKK